MDDYQKTIFLRTYSRWREDLGRRETWEEAVDRFTQYLTNRIKPQKLKNMVPLIKEFVQNLEVMPSMRAFWSAGESLDRENVQAYNCAYTPLESTKDFADMMYLLMCGTGVGFSVEYPYINKLPEVPETFTDESVTIVVGDSRQGWAEALYDLMNYLYEGIVPKVDYSHIRPAGSVLKTSGGRASGPEPLKQLFSFICNVFNGARGRQLTSLEVYDIGTYIANCVVAGGTRRSATISFSTLEDEAMKNAKNGEFWNENPHRSLSNNSVIFRPGVPRELFEREFENLRNSGTGERGIVFEESIIYDINRVSRTWDSHRLNPCGEVFLRPRQFCNLTEVIIRPDDTLKTLVTKAVVATFLGVFQATLTNFNFISPEWSKNSEEERLIGVSLSGLKDHPVLKDTTPASLEILQTLRDVVEEYSSTFAALFKIEPPASYTSIKPSGTVSQLVNCSSGLHPRWSKYYIRRVRVAKHDPLAEWLVDQGVEYEEDVYNNNTLVFSFYQEAPDTSETVDQKSAIEQLEYWQLLKENYTTHNPSITVYVKDDEWDEVKEWVWKHKPSGIALLPHNEHIYQQAPLEAISQETYEAKVSKALDFTSLVNFEFGDTGSPAGEAGCSNGSCVF